MLFGNYLTWYAIGGMILVCYFGQNFVNAQWWWPLGSRVWFNSYI